MKRPSITFLFCSLFVFVTSLIKPLSAQEITYYDLKCEHLINPLGVDAVAPRFTWKINDARRGAKQTSYRVIVGTDSMEVSRGIGSCWDTGEVSSSANLVVYEGQTLQPFTRYFWRVEGKDRDGKNFESASAAVFETGMMGKLNWKGAWISDRHPIDYRPAPYFRKEFSADKRIKSARLYIAAAGLYELYVNGEQVG